MRLTYWNANTQQYESSVYENHDLRIREEEVYHNNGLLISPMKYFVSGFAIDALAAYENTGLTPNEIEELQGDTLKKLKEANNILKRKNTEYFIEYEKLLSENRKLKSLLKDLLNKE